MRKTLLALSVLFLAVTEMYAVKKMEIKTIASWSA